MNIGDLFWSFRGNGAQLQKDAKVEGDKAGTTLGQRMSAALKKSWSGQEIGKGLVQGLGLAGGLGAATLFTGAISKLGDVLGDAKDAALAEEVSIQKLGTSLKANVAGWDGNTAAIERTLQARMKLGFSDDEQRDSLARIVVATKDVNKALAVQRTAMDLARLKGISLADAGDALIKVEGGQFRALKALGIQLPKNATAEQALLAVQKAAAGQAEDYAKTNAGKLLVSQVKMGEALEKLGAVILPAFVAGTEAAAAISEDLAGNLQGITDAGSSVQDILSGIGVGAGEAAKGEFDLFHAGQDLLAVMNPTKVSNTFGVLLDTLDNLGVSTDGLRTQFRGLGLDVADGADHSMDAIEAMRGSAMDDLAKTELALEDTGDAAKDMGDDIKYSAKVGSDSFETMRDKIVDAASDIVDEAYDVLDNAAALSAANAESAAAQRVLASSTASEAEKTDARETLREVGRDQAKLVLDLTAAGAGGSAKVTAAIADMKERLKTATGQERKAILATLAALEAVEAQAKVTYRNLVKVNAAGNVTRTGSTGQTYELRAGGGPVQARVPYIVGDAGRPEVFVPDATGYVYPDVQSGLAAVTAQGKTPTQINIDLSGQPIRDPFEVDRQMQRLADWGTFG